MSKKIVDIDKTPIAELASISVNECLSLYKEKVMDFIFEHGKKNVETDDWIHELFANYEKEIKEQISSFISFDLSHASLCEREKMVKSAIIESYDSLSKFVYFKSNQPAPLKNLFGNFHQSKLLSVSKDMMIDNLNNKKNELESKNTIDDDPGPLTATRLNKGNIFPSPKLLPHLNLSVDEIIKNTKLSIRGRLIYSQNNSFNEPLFLSPSQISGHFALTEYCFKINDNENYMNNIDNLSNQLKPYIKNLDVMKYLLGHVTSYTTVAIKNLIHKSLEIDDISELEDLDKEEEVKTIQQMLFDDIFKKLHFSLIKDDKLNFNQQSKILDLIMQSSSSSVFSKAKNKTP